MGEYTTEIIIAISVTLVVILGVFSIRRYLAAMVKKTAAAKVIDFKPTNSLPAKKQPSVNMLKSVSKIEIVPPSGNSIILSRLDSPTNLAMKAFQEITMSGNAIGANLVQGSLPILAQAQTLAQIAKAAPGGVFSATAPVSELIKYKDGTVGSIVMAGEKITNHAGFKEIAVSVANPAAVVGAGMQAMAMISGQYYMHRISKQLDGIERGMNRLIDFHHDANIGKLRSIENQMREITGKTYVDATDIIALQSGIRDADSVLIEYMTRLERLGNTGKITEIQVRSLWSHLSAVKELKKLKSNTEEYELLYSFQICLFASKLMLESKKAEFATRMKTGEIEKATEAFEVFKSMFQRSFLTNAVNFLENLYGPIDKKAESLVKRQWIESKKTNIELEAINVKKADLQKYIGQIIGEGDDEELIRQFSADSEMLYVPGAAGTEPRVFISTNK